MDLVKSWSEVYLPKKPIDSATTHMPKFLPSCTMNDFDHQPVGKERINLELKINICAHSVDAE